MTENWALDSIRSIFALIDGAVYGMISIVYDLLLQLSRTVIFTQEGIKDFEGRIYTLLAIFMLFKITFSFINYIVNPDQMSDKAKGANKIIINVVVVLILIIVTPTAFDKLVDLQNAILNDNVIPKFILGTEGDIGEALEYKIYDGCPNMSKAKSDGDYIALLTFRPFFQPDIAYKEFSGNDTNNDNDDLIMNDINKHVPSYCQIGEVGQYNGTVYQYLNSKIYNSAPGVWDGSYVIDYKFFISTAVGIVVLLILISFCFDVAVRSIKLGFLQLIAPIPIISYIDPDSSKNGMFKKWLKEVGKTWADLFVRLIALFFAIYIIKMITTSGELKDISANPLTNKFWVDLFIIIGALIFAKKLPSLIESILGIKIDGALTLNPFKKIADQALGGKAISKIATKGVTGIGGAVLGGSLAFGSTLANKLREKDPNALKYALKGGLHGGKNAMLHGFKGDKLGKSVSGSINETGSKVSEMETLDNLGVKLTDLVSNKFGSSIGLTSTAKKQDYQAKQYSDFLAIRESIDKRAEAEVEKANFDGITDKKNKVDYLKNNKGTAEDITKAYGDYKKSLKAAKIDYINKHSDNQIEKYMEKAEELRELNKEFEGFKDLKKIITGDAIDESKQFIEDAKINLENSKAWTKEHAIAEYNKKAGK